MDEIQIFFMIDPQFAGMDSKKLQALQQANSHLAPMPQTKPPTFQHGDFRPSRSPVFQNYPQYQSLASNFAHINMTNNPQDVQQQQQLHTKGTFPQQHQPNSQLGYHDQIYQSTNHPEKIYHHQSRGQFPGVHQHVHANSARLQQQFQALEQEKRDVQMRTQNEALMHQQQTFALRQQLNPPVPTYQIQSQTSSMSNMSSINNVPQHLLQNNRTLPPSSLNLTNQYQPAQGPMKLNNPLQQHQIMMLQNERQMVQQRQIQAVQQQMYQQQIQMQKQIAQQQQQQQNQQQTPTEVPMIQQNIPGQVVNQAVQTQISGSGIKTKSPETPGTTSTSTPSTPSHNPLERKKSEPVHTLKSPVAKRHPNAPVALSGWLWKQGSEGLKVWRKRWFVLSEYCLFYYKGPEEEKIMGSVLLPSYRISACTADDKANRKYAFKCEHTNMRTYVLAAENPESMGQWVKALMMAALMQGSSESESQPSISSFIPSGASAGDNSDSGIHTFQSQQGKMNNAPVTPASDNSGQQQHQPLYANAPPKPRRVTDCGYSSPSPENANDHYGQRMRQDPIYGYKQPVNRSMTKTPDPALNMRMQQMRLDQNKSPSALKSPIVSTYPYPSDQRTALEQEQYMQKLILHQQQLQQQQKYLANTIPMSYNNERRTPDTYGPPRIDRVSNDRRTFGDYEDIYQIGKASSQVMPQVAQSQQPTTESGYRRPLSPTKYDNNIQIPPMPQRYTPNFLEHQQQQQQQQSQQVHMRSKPPPTVPRPHSADFLEYEARNPVTTRMKAEPAQAPRPKSSLDINRGQDNSYYSESSYAEKMRQSALYLQKQTIPNKVQDSFSHQQQQSGEYIYKFYNNIELKFLHFLTTEMHPSMSSQTLQREIEMVRANRYEITDDMQSGSASVPRVHRQNGSKHQQHLSQQEQFLRSASARLPKKEEDPNRVDGERKREESMKRLLEWKQRMLQSPLTRKGPQLSVAAQANGQQTNSLHLPPKSPLTVQSANFYQQQPIESQQKSNHVLQRSRSDTNATSAYNGESSEDEACALVVTFWLLPCRLATSKKKFSFGAMLKLSLGFLCDGSGTPRSDDIMINIQVATLLVIYELPSCQPELLEV
ncbi:CLUMA_CG002668, isoform A [Clunio marinus]|uniref:CLUMA_CG002668, isoform A n=1 Tax=Clunio marinus TaxID=568069 RepID=A0A1J1HLA9_9DIPT|nr:CLUMA_CG002668, isoform A [Clunio marinus]